MPRRLCAYTFDQLVITKLDDLATTLTVNPALGNLLPFNPVTLNESRTLDYKDLSKEDYESLYAAMLPPPKPTKWGKMELTSKADERLPNWLRFLAIAGKQPNCDELIDRARTLQRKNRRQAQRTSKPPVINASRIAEALITLGLEAWNERVARLESERSSGENASQGRNELFVAGRREDVAVQTL